MAIGMVDGAVPAIDPGAGLGDAVGAVVTGVNANQGTILLVAGGLLGIGVLWKFTKKFVKP